jgi:hypothetical protein
MWSVSASLCGLCNTYERVDSEVIVQVATLESQQYQCKNGYIGQENAEDSFLGLSESYSGTSGDRRAQREVAGSLLTCNPRAMRVRSVEQGDVARA